MTRAGARVLIYGIFSAVLTHFFLHHEARTAAVQAPEIAGNPG
jgi:hypothetical protein